MGIGTAAPAYKLDVNGSARISGPLSATSFFYTSDQNLKKDIKVIESPLEKIRKLHGYTFLWKSTDEPDVGLIAQEVEQVFPELIGQWQGADGVTYKTVKYGNLVAPIIAAIDELAKHQQEQDQRILDQDKKIEELISRIDAQDRLIQSLQAS